LLITEAGVASCQHSNSDDVKRRDRIWKEGLIGGSSSSGGGDGRDGHGGGVYFRLFVFVIFRPLACSCFAALARGLTGERDKVENQKRGYFWDLLALLTTTLGEKLVFGNMDN
jgi:hypothetical protein